MECRFHQLLNSYSISHDIFIRFLRVYNLQYSIELDIDIVHSSGLPVDETRLQYILSAISEIEVTQVKSKNSGMWSHGGSSDSQGSRSDAQYSKNRSQKKKVAASDQATVDSLEASSSKKAIEVSVSYLVGVKT